MKKSSAEKLAGLRSLRRTQADSLSLTLMGKFFSSLCDCASGAVGLAGLTVFAASLSRRPRSRTSKERTMLRRVCCCRGSGCSSFVVTSVAFYFSVFSFVSRRSRRSRRPYIILFLVREMAAALGCPFALFLWRRKKNTTLQLSATARASDIKVQIEQIVKIFSSSTLDPPTIISRHVMHSCRSAGLLRVPPS